MDVMLIIFGQEFLVFVVQFDYVECVICVVLLVVYQLVQGGIVVGIGFNVLKGFVDVIVVEIVVELGLFFVVVLNKFVVLVGYELLVIFFGVLKSLVVVLMKIVNDLCLFGLGLCVGFVEVKLLVNELGSLIMFGKVNLI